MRTSGAASYAPAFLRTKTTITSGSRPLRRMLMTSSDFRKYPARSWTATGFVRTWIVISNWRDRSNPKSFLKRTGGYFVRSCISGYRCPERPTATANSLWPGNV